MFGANCISSQFFFFLKCLLSLVHVVYSTVGGVANYQLYGKSNLDDIKFVIFLII